MLGLITLTYQHKSRIKEKIWGRIYETTNSKARKI